MSSLNSSNTLQLVKRDAELLVGTTTYSQLLLHTGTGPHAATRSPRLVCWSGTAFSFHWISKTCSQLNMSVPVQTARQNHPFNGNSGSSQHRTASWNCLSNLLSTAHLVLILYKCQWANHPLEGLLSPLENSKHEREQKDQAPASTSSDHALTWSASWLLLCSIPGSPQTGWPQPLMTTLEFFFN